MTAIVYWTSRRRIIGGGSYSAIDPTLSGTTRLGSIRLRLQHGHAAEEPRDTSRRVLELANQQLADDKSS